MKAHQDASNSKMVMTDFTTLADGSVAELIEDPDDATQTLFAVCHGGITRYERQLEVGGRTIVPFQRHDEVLRHIRLARGVQPYEDVMKLFAGILQTFRQCLDLDDLHLCWLSYLALSTWFIDRLPVAPYLALLGPPQSGKTTILRVLSLVCRRSLLTNDVSSAAFYRACDRFTPTLLIDETATAGDKQQLFHLLRTGSTPGFVALRRGDSFRCFGAKAVAWIELPNDAALNSRCIIIPTRESRRNNLLRPTDPRILKFTDTLQRAALQFRLEKYQALTAPQIPEGPQIYSRSRDIFQALGLPVSEEPRLLDPLAFFLEEQQQLSREPLSPRQAAVLRTSLACAHDRATERHLFLMKSFTQAANLSLKFVGEKFQMNEREVGAVLTSLGIANRKRTNQGWAICMDRALREYLHRLATEHGIENEAIQSGSRKSCELCNELRTGETQQSSSQSIHPADRELNKIDQRQNCHSRRGRRSANSRARTHSAKPI